MDVLRTADDRFDDLIDFPFAPHYVTVRAEDGTELRIHHVDEGPRDADVVLCMHGEPTWSYLYRHIIRDLVERGHRVIAPDLVGFGRSDKPVSQDDYTYEGHVDWMSQWLLTLDLADITLFCQDWGGLIGLRLVAAFPERFGRVIAGNTGLPMGQPPGPGFQAWLDFSQQVPTFPVGQIVNGGTVRQLTEAEIAAYDAPFPDESYKAGARRFPALVPISSSHPSVAENEAAWRVLDQFTRPFLTAFSDQDQVTAGGEGVFQRRVPGAQGREHVTILGGGHFLQEDKPAELAELIDQFTKVVE